VASPCTAPFMGASLGAGVTLPAAEALSVFAALGLGMALPYLAASAWPGLARACRGPGRGWRTFKTLMAFPMFATVVWLVWVLGQQTGIDGAAALLGALLALAFAPGRWARHAGAARGAPASAPVAAAAGRGAGLGLPVAQAGGSRHPAAPPPTHDWQPWSPERVAELHARRAARCSSTSPPPGA
jgi:thiol:disulfide interchange protein